MGISQKFDRVTYNGNRDGLHLSNPRFESKLIYDTGLENTEVFLLLISCSSKISSQDAPSPELFRGSFPISYPCELTDFGSWIFWLEHIILNYVKL